MNLYNRTDIYDLFDDESKYYAIKKHWIKILEDKKIHSLLDVSIGTGSLTLPLAELGVCLYGSDLNELMLKRCREKAHKKGFQINLRQSDFRSLMDKFEEKFDCVASTGNSLPYVSNDEIHLVVEQMDKLIKPGGYFYCDMRNWDKILKEKNRFYLYNPVFIEGTRVNLIQVWDYNSNETMTFHLLYTFEKENKIIQKEQFEEHYYPIKREILINQLCAMGYKDIQIMCHPAYFEQVDLNKVDWYCIIARKDSI